jgi:hypothetical protein
MLLVRQGTTINFLGKEWAAEEHALSLYLDCQGPTVFETTAQGQPVDRVFAEAKADGELTIRDIALVDGEMTEGSGMGKVGVPGGVLGMVNISPNDLYEG